MNLCLPFFLTCLQEALSVVSEDQSIFDPSFSTPHLLKTELPSVDDYGSKEGIGLEEPQWPTQATNNRGHVVKQENEQVNCSSRLAALWLGGFASSRCLRCARNKPHGGNMWILAHFGNSTSFATIENH